MQFTTSPLDFSILPFTGENPPVTKPNPEFLTDIGEDGMRDLLKRFYIKLANSSIKDVFPVQGEEAMIEASKNSADFFIQISGGPKYFNQNRGAPQMRGRHAPFPIGPNERTHWLAIFEEALEPIIEQKLSSNENIQSFWNYINVFSMWMVNRA